MVVSSRPESTDSAWDITSAVTLPSRRSASSKMRAGAPVSARSASITAMLAPFLASDSSMALVAPFSTPQDIRSS